MATRRSVLRVLGLVPVAAPIAAKAAADQAIADLAGISSMGSAGLGSTAILGGAGGLTQSGSDDWKKQITRFLAEKTLPAWFEDDLRTRCQHVNHLDPDIASKRSWSMNVKIAAQRERNVKRAMSDVFEGHRRSIRVQEFANKFGIWL